MRTQLFWRITIFQGRIRCDLPEIVSDLALGQWMQRIQFHLRPLSFSQKPVRIYAARFAGVQPIVNDLTSLRLEAWDSPPPGLVEPVQLNRHGVADRDISWKATTASGVISVSAGHLPFPDASFQRVVLADLLEYVRDEKVALAETRRVLVKDGLLTVLVPYHGPTTWLDGANWHRYLHDLRGSDTLLPELAESGWRRRYRKDDLRILISESGFSLESMDQRGTGLSELGWFIGRLLEEKRTQVTPNSDLDIIRIRYAARSLDRRVQLGPLGSWLIVEATKR